MNSVIDFLKDHLEFKISVLLVHGDDDLVAPNAIA